MSITCDNVFSGIRAAPWRAGVAAGGCAWVADTLERVAQGRWLPRRRGDNEPVVGFWQRLVGWLQPLPSFEEIRQMNLEAASTFTRERVITELERYPFSCGETRDEILRLARSRPFDAAAYARCRALTGLDGPQYGPPGAIEEVWVLEGLIERLRALGEAERR